MPSLLSPAFWFALLLPLATPALAQPLVGGSFDYTVVKGDYLTRIGARFGTDPVRLARENGLDYFGHIHPGQRLAVDNRHVVPPAREDGIIINIPQRMLYLFRHGQLVAHYPVGVGRPDWPTPTGLFTITEKVTDKAWIVPKSIQAEMRAQGLEVRTSVPAGPDNPLGRHWMRLVPGAWGIHGTIAPASVYHFQSHGCVRLHPDDAAQLYGLVKVGESVEVVYRPLLLARGEDGQVYLEVHRDLYNRGVDRRLLLQAEIERTGLGGELDGSKVDQVLQRTDAVARVVGPPAAAESDE